MDPIVIVHPLCAMDAMALLGEEHTKAQHLVKVCALIPTLITVREA